MPKVNDNWEIDSGLSPLGKYRIPKDKNFSGEHRPLNEASVKSCESLDGNFAQAVSSAIDDWKRSGGFEVSLGKRGWISRKDAGKEARNNNRKVYLNNIRLFGWGLAAEVDNVSTVYSFMRDSGTYYSESQIDMRSVTANDVRGQFDACLGAYGLALFYDQESSSANDKGMFICPMHFAYDADISEPEYDADYYSESSTSVSGSISDEPGQASVSSIAYFFSNQFSQVQGQAMSFMLRGNRALANDTPLFDTIKDAVNTSLRSFSSGPNGEFVAWYPDWWGLYGTTATLVLSDLELLDLTITQNGDKFYSHVYCSGVDAAGSSIDFYRTQGVVSIESNIDALSSSASLSDDEQESASFDVSDEVSDIMQAILGISNDDPDAWKYTPKELYRRYGARPKKLPGTKLIESGAASDIGYESNPQYILPFLHALYGFMEAWADQYTCNLTITYMPNLFPGMRIRLESIDLEMYVSQVTHNMSYSSGFTTSVVCKCPKGSLVSGMVNPDFSGVSESGGDIAYGGVKDAASSADIAAAAANSKAQSVIDASSSLVAGMAEHYDDDVSWRDAGSDTSTTFF